MPSALPPKPATGDLNVAGDLFVADGAHVLGNLRCQGNARIGAAAVVEGDVDVAGSLAVRRDARITGRVECAGDVDWHPTATAAALRCGGTLRLNGEAVAASVEAARGVVVALDQEAA